MGFIFFFIPEMEIVALFQWAYRRVYINIDSN